MGTNESDRPRIVAGIDGSPSWLAHVSGPHGEHLTGSALTVVGTWHVPSTYTAGITDDYDPATDMQHVLDDSLPAIQQRHRTLRSPVR